MKPEKLVLSDELIKVDVSTSSAKLETSTLQSFTVEIRPLSTLLIKPIFFSSVS